MNKEIEKHSYELIKVRYEISGEFIARNTKNNQDIDEVAKDAFRFNALDIFCKTEDKESRKLYASKFNWLSKMPRTYCELSEPFYDVHSDFRYGLSRENIGGCLRISSRTSKKDFINGFIKALIKLSLYERRKNSFLINEVLACLQESVKFEDEVTEISNEEIFNESKKSGILYEYSQFGNKMLLFFDRHVEIMPEFLLNNVIRLDAIDFTNNSNSKT